MTAVNGADRPPLGHQVGFAGVLALASGASTITVFAISALAPSIVDDLGIGRGRFGFITLGVYGVAAITAPAIGKTVDRLGGRSPVLLVFAVAGFGVAAMAAAPTYWLIVAAGALPGVALGIANPATNRLVAFNIPAHRQGLYMGIKSSGGQASALGAGLVLPWLARFVGWRWALASVAVVGVGGFLASLRYVPRDGAKTAPDGPTPSTSGVRWVLVHGFFTSLALGPVVLYLPLYAFERLDYSAIVAGSTTAIFGGVSVVARLIWGRFADRLTGIHRALSLIALFSGASVLVISSAEYAGSWVVWIGVVGFGASGGAWVTLAMFGLIRVVAVGEIGHASGLLQFVGIIGFLMGPILFGVLVDATDSYTVGMLAVVALFVVAGTVALPRHRRVSRLVEEGDGVHYPAKRKR